MVSAYAMASRIYCPPCRSAIIIGITTLLLTLAALTCGCLDIEPEELPPGITPSPMETAVATPVVDKTPEVPAGPPPEVTITSPKQVRIYTEQDFSPEVKAAIGDFTTGRTAESINGFLRWESVRARTSREDAAIIREQVRLINSAFYNTSLKENVSVYIGLNAEQARRIHSEGIFSENGYATASYDPSVIYQRFSENARDSDGYFAMCVIDFRPGNRILFVNATNREFLLPQDTIRDVAGEYTYEELVFSADSIPRYKDIIPRKVRIIRTTEHP